MLRWLIAVLLIMFGLHYMGELHATSVVEEGFLLLCVGIGVLIGVVWWLFKG
jgi:cytochrome c biogenesis protein CcdA